MERNRRHGKDRNREPKIGEMPLPPAGLPVPQDEVAPGILYVVATPIGNLDDMTIRAIQVLGDVHLIAAEDTRHTRILLDRYRIATPMTSLHDHIERKKSGALLERLLKGEHIAYVSDAGTPGISDPGYVLVREAINHGIRVVPIPGASAVITALSASGMPMDSFVFLGFLPSKSEKRRQLLTTLKDEQRTLIFYESPRRLAATLRDIEGLLGAREVVISRELTKIHEEFLRGQVGTLIGKIGDGVVKGEVTLIVAGHSGVVDYSDEELVRRREKILREEGNTLSRRDVVEKIARETGASRKRIYRLLLFS